MATNWQKAVSQEDFNELNAKVGNSTDDETKVTLFGKLAKVFQSVSSGKSKIATAITGKGIATLGSDTFAKMAGNIDLIKMVSSGDAGKILAGQSINGINGTATNDANAVAGDMLSGKTGYVKGLKVSGTMADNGAVGIAIANGVLKQGYTTGGAIANLLAGNVKKGVNIGGVVGTVSGLQAASPINAEKSFPLVPNESKTIDCTGEIIFISGLLASRELSYLVGSDYGGYKDVVSISLSTDRKTLYISHLGTSAYGGSFKVYTKSFI